MLQVTPSLIPSISISFAPHELPPVEPKPPFTVSSPTEPDTPRPQLLFPPPLLSHVQPSHKERHGQLSPLSSSSSNSGKGLERERFETMLKASRERSAMVGAKKPVELRKEIAMKAQKAKQCERRARFLSKLVAPPSPTAADMPVTPPDSPAVFHFSLPSPGLVSPLELFEDLANHPELYDFKTTIEQVDFRLPQQKQEAVRHRILSGSSTPGTPLPSLDQISRRLGGSSALITTARSSPPDHVSTTGNRLPSFLRSRKSSPSLTAAEPSPTVPPSPGAGARNRHLSEPPTLVLPISTGLTDVAVRTPSPIATPVAIPVLPRSPKSPRCPQLQITTTYCPPTRSKSSPTKFTEANITQFGTTHSSVPKRTVVPSVPSQIQVQMQRVQVSRDLLSKLSRRTSGLPRVAVCGVRAQDDTSPALSPSTSSDDKLKRRLTAPAEMTSAQRGTRHPVQDRPGGF